MTLPAPAEAPPALAPEARDPHDQEPIALPEGVLRVRLGPGANCSSAGSAIDVLFYGSVLVGALAVALAAAFPPAPPRDDDDRGDDAPRPVEPSP